MGTVVPSEVVHPLSIQIARLLLSGWISWSTKTTCLMRENVTNLTQNGLIKENTASV